MTLLAIDRLDIRPFGLFPRDEQQAARLDGANSLQILQAGRHLLSVLPDGVSRQRKLEYLVTRACAAELLHGFGAPTLLVTNGEDRAPIWPENFVGSITHTDTLAAVLVRRRELSASVGIDAEKLIDNAAAAQVERYCLLPGESESCAQAGPLSGLPLLTLLFCAKEAFFKCLYPLARKYFGFKDAIVDMIDHEHDSIRIRLINSPANALPCGFSLTGCYRFELGHVFTAFDLREADLRNRVSSRCRS